MLDLNNLIVLAIFFLLGGFISLYVNHPIIMELKKKVEYFCDWHVEYVEEYYCYLYLVTTCSAVFVTHHTLFRMQVFTHTRRPVTER